MKKIILILGLLFIKTFIFAQTMSLSQILDQVESHHPLVKMYDDEIKSMDEAAKGARSWMPPQIGFGQFMTPYSPALWLNRGEMKGMGSAMISVEQMFPNKKKLDADEAYMTHMSAVEKELKNSQLNDVVQDAKKFYYDWIVLNKKLKVAHSNEKVLQLMIHNAELRYQNGMDKISAYYKAQAALGTTQNMLLMYQNEIKEKKIRLNSLMGKNAMDDFDIDTAYQLKDYATVVFDSTLFYQLRSDFKAIDERVNLNTLQQNIEKQSLKPQFSLKFDHMQGYSGQNAQYSLMAMLKLPMVAWSSKMNKAKIESLKWKNNALLAQKEMMLNEFEGMSYGMLNELNLKKKQLNLYDKSILPALDKNFKTMQLGFENNTEELFMLYDAWEKINMTQIEYFEILNKAFEIQVTLDRLMEKK